MRPARQTLVHRVTDGETCSAVLSGCRLIVAINFNMDLGHVWGARGRFSYSDSMWMELARTLESTWPGQAVRTYTWLFPGLEVVHLLGLTTVFGGMVALDLRLLGMRRNTLSVSVLQRHILPLVWIGFAIATLSGLWLISFQATQLVNDEAFVIKMLLLPLAGLNAAFMHYIGQRGLPSWDIGQWSPPVVRISAVLSLLLWSGILACGRLIAYFYAPVFD